MWSLIQTFFLMTHMKNSSKFFLNFVALSKKENFQKYFMDLFFWKSLKYLCCYEVKKVMEAKLDSLPYSLTKGNSSLLILKTIL